MGRKYYCDYCDKAFADNPTNRKNHARGVHHRQSMTAHYDLFKDAETQLREDIGKKPCRTYTTQGHCPFGSSCRFSHLVDERRKQLEKEVRAKEETRKRKQEKETASENFNVEEWVAKRLKTNSESDTKTQDMDTQLPTYTVPEVILNASAMPQQTFQPHFNHFQPGFDLPPSLIPPTVESYKNLERVEWGP